MAQGYGHNGWVGVGRETTWGTRVAPTVFERPIEESMKLNQSKMPLASLGTVGQYRNVSSRRFVDGGFKFYSGFNGMLGVLLNDAIGDASSAQVDASSAYDHTITPDSALPVGLSVQVSRDAGNISTAYDYEGCQIESLTLRQSNEAPLEVEVAFQGEEETKQSEASESFATLYQADYSMLTVNVNSVAQNIKEFELTISNSLATDRGNLGSRLRPGLGRGSGNREITGSMLIEFDDVTEYDLFRDLTEIPIVATWAAPANSIESGYAYNLAITMSQCYLEGPPDIGMKDNGPLMLPVDFRAFATTADNDEISVVLRNTDTAII